MEATVLAQYLLPKQMLTRAAGALAGWRGGSATTWLIERFIARYGVNMAEAADPDITAYKTFNDFFTRALKPGLRPQPAEPEIFSCPVDGAISQLGAIRQGQLFQAKGHSYSAAALLADEELGHSFHNGSFSTIYLAPHDYHRVHMPCTGRLRSWAYVPGRLFSVNPSTARAVPGLFARNERMVALFDTQFGPLALVMVGAIIVGGIETVWNGRLTPPHRRDVAPTYYQPMRPLLLERGAELGRFHMGSTVILLAPPGALNWDASLVSGKVVRLGQGLATMLR